MSPKKKIQTLRCPTCKTLVLREDPNFPFCSDRCRVIDLGKWASGGYVISSPITDPEEIEAVLEQQKKKIEDELDEGETHGKPN